MKTILSQLGRLAVPVADWNCRATRAQRHWWHHICTVFIEKFSFIHNYVARCTV